MPHRRADHGTGAHGAGCKHDHFDQPCLVDTTPSHGWRTDHKGRVTSSVGPCAERSKNHGKNERQNNLGHAWKYTAGNDAAGGHN